MFTFASMDLREIRKTYCHRRWHSEGRLGYHTDFALRPYGLGTARGDPGWEKREEADARRR